VLVRIRAETIEANRGLVAWDVVEWRSAAGKVVGKNYRDCRFAKGD
jgi:hypothetical protein